jgi:hypothetical protein
MKALSIRQPWAWLIIHGGKDIENRTWSTKLRGRVLVHAAKGMSRPEYDASKIVADTNNVYLPDLENFKRGGIVGSVEIVDCVTESNSPWFFGPYGFVLRDPRPLPFVPMKGMLGFFDCKELFEPQDGRIMSEAASAFAIEALRNQSILKP